MAEGDPVGASAGKLTIDISRLTVTAQIAAAFPMPTEIVVDLAARKLARRLVPLPDISAGESIDPSRSVAVFRAS